MVVLRCNIQDQSRALLGSSLREHRNIRNGSPFSLAESERSRFVAADAPRTDARRVPMSSTTDKIKGLANEAIGNVKQGIGNATGNEKLQAEGKAQELKGEAQKTVGDAKDGVKNAAQSAADAVKKI
jgi:uncharacterized protein YjbJ (UPF0337 family)